ncbi:hypothetical protein FRX31_021785, partial [Thalictrum thalictroides]
MDNSSGKRSSFTDQYKKGQQLSDVIILYPIQIAHPASHCKNQQKREDKAALNLLTSVAVSHAIDAQTRSSPMLLADCTHNTFVDFHSPPTTSVCSPAKWFCRAKYQVLPVCLYLCFTTVQP